MQSAPGITSEGPTGLAAEAGDLQVLGLGAEVGRCLGAFSDRHGERRRLLGRSQVRDD